MPRFHRILRAIAACPVSGRRINKRIIKQAHKAVQKGHRQCLVGTRQFAHRCFLFGDPAKGLLLYKSDVAGPIDADHPDRAIIVKQGKQGPVVVDLLDHFGQIKAALTYRPDAKRKFEGLIRCTCKAYARSFHRRNGFLLRPNLFAAQFAPKYIRIGFDCPASNTVQNARSMRLPVSLNP